MGRVGYKQLKDQLDGAFGGLIELPANVTPFALAKACYTDRYMIEGWDAWRDYEYRLYDAFGDMLTFIRSTFVDGERWVTNSAIMSEPDDSAYRLYEILDQKGKFSKASRILMDFVVRGEATTIRKRRGTTEYEQAIAF